MTISNQLLELIRAIRPENDKADPLEVLTRVHLSATTEPGDPAVATAIANLGILEAFPSLTSAELHDERTTAAAMQLAAAHGVKALIPGDDCYPAGLTDLDSPPAMLWFRGREEAVAALSHSIAVTGNRAVTDFGERITQELSTGVIRRGYTIVSGGAYGVDGAAHRAALAHDGTTVAILAGGLDRLFPAGHNALLSQIAASGAILSEVPCGATPTRWRLQQRDRLIAAVSQLTLVTEAGYRSGALSTATAAAKTGRPVATVIGPVLSAANGGCGRLIADETATAVEDIDGIVALIEQTPTGV